MLAQRHTLVFVLAGCCWVFFLAAVTQKACGQGTTNTPAATPKKSNQTPAAQSATPTPTASPSAKPAASAATPSTSDEDLLVPETSPKPAAQSSSDEDLLAPETSPKPGAKSSSDQDLLPESITVEPESLIPPEPPKLPPKTPGGAGAAPVETAAEAHARLLVENKFPSASTCATCHPKQFREWSFSQHAYAQMSPVFTTMQATIDKRTAGTNGDFCIRCHTQVGMQLKEPVFTSDLDRHATSREGITCIVCHRVKDNYGRVSGRTSIVEGDIFEPVYGPRGDKILKKVLSQPDEYQVVTKRGEVGRAVHTDVVKFDPLEKSRFCGTCHDVNLLNGFRLEEAFSQYKNTSSRRKGESCQDCHMGKIPGIKSGYEYGPAAMIGDKPTPPRKLTNHTFAGPDYSIIHPGLYPFNTKAQQMATLRQWLQFDYKAGWGTDAFENNAPSDYVFPPRWKSIDDRYDARAILDDQFARLEEANKERYQVLRRAFQLHDFVLEENDSRAIKFKIKVVNATDGHAVPTGFDAERANFLQVTVTDRRGKVLFRSGDRDPNGDYRDEESAYVHDRKLPLDKYLFSLQSKFLVTLLRGGERVQVLPTNKSIDPLPYVRPATNADELLARPPGARKQSIGIPPNGFRWARYAVNGRLLSGQPPYKVNVKFIAQMIPVNLMADIAEVGFDYNMSPKDLANRVVERCQILWNKTVVLPPHPTIFSFKPSEAEIMAPPTKPFLPLAPATAQPKNAAKSAKPSSN
jgi:hypothetical protein